MDSTIIEDILKHFWSLDLLTANLLVFPTPNLPSLQMKRIEKTRLDSTASIQHLLKLKEVEQRVSKLAANEIIFSPALITRKGIPIIGRGTINMIQGKSGSFKSRLAELMCSLALCPDGKTIDFSLDFEKVDGQQLMVLLVDTERNQTEEFPSAIKSIVKKLGMSDPAQISNFRFTSLKNVNRDNRLQALKIFIEDIRKESTDPLFVLLDVVTDIVANFNDPAESMQLFDYIGNMCEELDATFLLVIHENPGSEKGRGHAGTEALNKSSTVIHIGYEKTRSGELSELLQMKFIKQRHAKRLDPIPIIFSQESMSLQLADPGLVKSIADQRRSKASLEDIGSTLATYLQPELGQKDLLTILCAEFNCSPNTIKTRLEEVAESGLTIANDQGVSCNLSIISQNGKPTVYTLTEVPVLDLVD